MSANLRRIILLLTSSEILNAYGDFGSFQSYTSYTPSAGSDRSLWMIAMASTRSPHGGAGKPLDLQNGSR